MDTNELLKRHPELAKEVDALIAERLGAADAQKYEAEAKAYPRFVFSVDSGARNAESPVRIVNTFGHETGGTVCYALGHDAYLVRVDEDAELVVHEAWEAWK